MPAAVCSTPTTGDTQDTAEIEALSYSCPAAGPVIRHSLSCSDLVLLWHLHDLHRPKGVESRPLVLGGGGAVSLMCDVIILVLSVFVPAVPVIEEINTDPCFIFLRNKGEFNYIVPVSALLCAFRYVSIFIIPQTTL